MKMNYIAPEAKLLGFVPAEATATSFDDLLNGSGGVIYGPGQEVETSNGDITIEDIDVL